GLRVGIHWHGRGETDGRAIPLARFAPLARVPGVKLFSVQKGSGAEQAAGCGFPLVDLGPRLDTGPDALTDTAAVLANLDLFVCTDTGPAHLAGAMGGPTWLVLSTVANFEGPNFLDLIQFPAWLRHNRPDIVPALDFAGQTATITLPRWGFEGDRTDLYPSMRLFRQGQGEDWYTVMARV